MHTRLSLIPAVAAFATAFCACSHTDPKGKDVLEFGPEAPVAANTAPEAAPASGSAPEGQHVPVEAAPSPRLSECADLTKVFNDSNHVHTAEAEQIGIVPLSDTRSIWHMRRPVVKIATCNDFVVDKLTHSRPYLIPEAAEMVHKIGQEFSRRVKERYGTDVRMIVTSVLRTPDAVRRLRRVNRNAVEGSVHQMGTTVDITYNKFLPSDSVTGLRPELLKRELAAVLDEMRANGEVWVKYEVKQPCFHITVRRKP